MALEAMKIRAAIAACLIAVGALTQAHAERTLKPVDQAATRADFYAFRAQLQAAIARRDAGALLAGVDRNIRNSFGDNNGVDAFRQIWEPEDRRSRVWEVLGEVLALGGSFDREGSFVAPYVFSRWPRDADAFTHAAILGASVPVRAAASPSSPVAASLSFSIVEQIESRGADESWVQIRLPRGKTGFVDRRFIRSPVDYRAIFSKRDGKWKMTAFLAGD
ncbi:SH3 domain-containing protein [Noviherbaspirillum aridicola]|uniref:SH3 domain-containing protein n=1 Tax=Noviherbaspirillum aridicola TaxID=2849687 RepID=A0ABQ4PZA3_9BURK|nr:SH3 domain-containing protein [Noviherbaspirillum aridicola]GIZ50184.1 hypothetical protein NCCP691_01980 [Noviherbaspirillum aridicola]